MRSIGAAVWAALLLLGGCGGADTVKLEGGNGSTIEVSGVGTGGASVPANLPPFAPIYPGASVQTTTLSQNQPDKGMMTLNAPKADLAAIIAFYKEKGVAAGLNTAMEMTTGEARVLTMAPPGAERTEGSRGMQVTATPDGDGGATITVVYQNEKAGE